MSTDDVFDGDSEVPYNEFDNPVPRSIYGKSKLAGEQMVSSLCTRHIIIRSSWVYGTGADFVHEFLEADGRIEVASDECAVPTLSLIHISVVVQDISEIRLEDLI